MGRILQHGRLGRIAKWGDKSAGRSGRGVPKIVDECGRDSIAIYENSLVVTVPFVGMVSTAKWGDKWGDKPASRPDLNATQQAVLAAVADDPNITQPALEKLVGKSRNTVQRSLSFLRDNGFIERVGSRKVGYWKVLKCNDDAGWRNE